jgi:hypothetical protein
MLKSAQIFLAVKHVSSAGIVHTAISTRTIRFCNSGKPLLCTVHTRDLVSGITNYRRANFEDCICSTADRTSNVDLEGIGIALLECMSGSPNESLRNPNEVRRLRELNKTFGLENGEKWSHQKLLVDFLDNMFSASIPAIAKLDKPVSTCYYLTQLTSC